ncbi:MAG TPA: STM4015 family protein [Kineosporiaceae bacterium]|nr:STM4015 family protein [Kineosporiaceae bacterium]
MTFNDHLTSFAGRPVVDVPAGEPLPAVEGPVAWRLSEWDDDWDEGVPSPKFAAAFDDFVREHGPSVESLVIGAWGYAAFNPAPIGQLIRLAPALPALRSLFLGDMTSEECEVSWMKVGDVSGLLEAYPELEVFGARGGEDFRFSAVNHPRLRELVVQSGGLSREFVQAVLDSDLPALEKLELWFGDEDYGGNTTVEDLAPLLAGDRFPALRRLGLCNSELADELAEALACAPVVARLERLDLSSGTLGDRGAAALLAGQPLTHLAELDLHYHYLSPESAHALVAAYPGVRVDVADRQEADGDYRYVAVSE